MKKEYIKNQEKKVLMIIRNIIGNILKNETRQYIDYSN